MPQVVRRIAAAVALLLVASLTGVSSAHGVPVGDQPVAGAGGAGDASFPQDGNGGYDVTHYDVHDSYDVGTDRLSGLTDVSATATSSLSSFHLDLLLSADTVSVDGQIASSTKPTRHELFVAPATPIARGSDFVVRVAYHGTPASISYDGERAWQRDGTEATATGQPHMAPWWFPADDHPGDKATFDISMSVPSAQEAISNGDLVTQDESDGRVDWHWRMDQPMATYLAFVAVGGSGSSRAASAVGRGSTPSRRSCRAPSRARLCGCCATGRRW